MTRVGRLSPDWFQVKVNNEFKLFASPTDYQVAHHNLLQGASEVLQEEKVEFPPELCQGVLKVAVAADDATVRENITEFRYVIQKAVLAMKQRQHVDSETLSTDEEATKMMNDSLEMVNSLNPRFPGLVREGTLNILTDVQNWHL